MKSIKKNYIYNLTYQLLIMIAPLITTPHVCEVLGSAGNGVYSYTFSVVSFFVLFAALGITTYGQREISYVRDSREKTSQVFWETKTLEIITSSLVLGVYLLFVLVLFKSGNKNSMCYLVLSCEILSVLCDVSWLFQGLEEFKKIATRNVVIKIISIIYIFAMVNSKDDVLIYILGTTLFNFISNVWLWVYLPKYVDKPKFRDIKPFRNIKIVGALFIPTIAIQIYTVLDKTMIGLITHNNSENGYYDKAILISKVTLTIITSLGAVMIPRIGYYFNKGDKEQINQYLYKVFNYVWFAGIPLTFGLAGTASNFVPWFLRGDFAPTIGLIKILSFLVVIIGLSNVTGLQYLIPTKRENSYTKTVIMGSVINFLLNLILIRLFASTGAAIASVAAEISVTAMQMYIVRKEIPLKPVFKLSIKYLVAGIVMFVALKLAGQHLSPSMIHTAIMVAGGMIVYFGMLLILKDQFLGMVLNRVLKRKQG